MGANLSNKLNDHIHRMFKPSEIDRAKALATQIYEAGGGGQAPDRCAIAALKVSGGSITKLEQAVDLFHLDFRDLLMAAGFGHDTGAHEKWEPTA